MQRAAFRFLSNLVLGLHYDYALPVPLHVFCCKDQLGMSLLNRSCVQLEFGAAGESSSSSEFTQLLRGSVHVGPCTAAALASSSHTTTSSLCRAHSPCLCGVLLSTGWYCWRFDFRPPRGPWECKFHMWLTVPAVQCLEQSLAPPSERV